MVILTPFCFEMPWSGLPGCGFAKAKFSTVAILIIWRLTGGGVVFWLKWEGR